MNMLNVKPCIHYKNNPEGSGGLIKASGGPPSIYEISVMPLEVQKVYATSDVIVAAITFFFTPCPMPSLRQLRFSSPLHPTTSPCQLHFFRNFNTEGRRARSYIFYIITFYITNPSIHIRMSLLTPLEPCGLLLQWMDALFSGLKNLDCHSLPFIML